MSRIKYYAAIGIGNKEFDKLVNSNVVFMGVKKISLSCLNEKYFNNYKC